MPALRVATQISGLANSLYGLQLQSDNDIGSAINNVNSDLQNLQTRSMPGWSRHRPPTRARPDSLISVTALLNDIAQYIDIKPTYQGGWRGDP